MWVQVGTAPNHLGLEMPVRFRFDGREVEIVEIVDQCASTRVSRVELTMFQRPGVASPLNALTENWILASQGSRVPGSARLSRC
jgi:hypothetical protein